MRGRKTIDYINLFFKGVFMGIADAIPGISGGTIALLTGIYEELITTIGGININLISELKNNGFESFWKKLNGNFLMVLISGIGLSLISFVKISSVLFDDYPLFIWSFFLGLILATVYIIFKLIRDFTLVNILFSIIAIVCIHYTNTILTTEIATEIELNNIHLYILFCGIIASSAMIVPGISGSLILVILGVYNFIINALNNLEISIILPFTFGALIGLLGFSRVLKYLFRNYRNITYSLMLGFVVGSIEKVWPWNKEFSTEISNTNMFLSISLVIFGFSLVLLLERIKKSNDRK